MWPFLEGVKEPPSKKPRLSNEERKAQVKEYEQERRKRSYNEKWMLDDNNKRREWLEYDSNKNQIHCKDCRMYANGVPEKGTLCHWNTKFHAYWLIITHL